MFPCTPCPPQQYQPLPISTGNVGIDRCGNIDVYAAPGVVHRRVCWDRWPIPYQGWRYGWGSWPPVGGGTYPMPVAGLANVLRAGAPMADWMIKARQQGGVP